MFHLDFLTPHESLTLSAEHCGEAGAGEPMHAGMRRGDTGTGIHTGVYVNRRHAVVMGRLCLGVDCLWDGRMKWVSGPVDAAFGADFWGVWDRVVFICLGFARFIPRLWAWGVVDLNRPPSCSRRSAGNVSDFN